VELCREFIFMFQSQKLFVFIRDNFDTLLVNTCKVVYLVNKIAVSYSITQAGLRKLYFKYYKVLIYIYNKIRISNLIALFGI